MSEQLSKQTPTQQIISCVLIFAPLFLLDPLYLHFHLLLLSSMLMRTLIGDYRMLIWPHYYVLITKETPRQNSFFRNKINRLQFLPQ